MQANKKAAGLTKEKRKKAAAVQKVQPYQIDKKIKELTQQGRNFDVCTSTGKRTVRVLADDSSKPAFLLETPEDTAKYLQEIENNENTAEYTEVLQSVFFPSKLDADILNTIKEGQKAIINHVLSNPHLKELLIKVPPIRYNRCKTFMSYQTFSLHQIDIKSAYFEAAYKLGFIPESLKEEFDGLEEKYKARGQAPEVAKANAKTARIILLGSLAKSEEIQKYRIKKNRSGAVQHPRQRFHIDTETGEVSNLYGNMQDDGSEYNVSFSNNRVKGDIIANIFFRSAYYIGQLLDGIFNEDAKATKENFNEYSKLDANKDGTKIDFENKILFFWVDAIFCRVDAVEAVKKTFRDAGFNYKEYPPVSAIYSNFSYYLQKDPATPIDLENAETYKPYFFEHSKTELFYSELTKKDKIRIAREQVNILQYGTGEDYTTEENGEFVSSDKFLICENWARLRNKLYCSGISPDDFIRVSLKYKPLFEPEKIITLALENLEEFVSKIKPLKSQDVFIKNFAVK